MDREEALKLLRGGKEGIDKWNWARMHVGKNDSLFDLSGVDLGDTFLRKANLRCINFADANLRSTNMIGANLSNSNLMGVNLKNADLLDANLDGTDLSLAYLLESKFHNTSLKKAVFSMALLGNTIFSCDLSQVIGLESTRHVANSFLDTQSILTFKSDLPEKFLKGCGLRDEEIAYFRAQVGKPIRFYTCFISYSTADEEFASRLYNDFQGAGIRCWKWDKDARTGKSIWGEIDHAIRQFNKLVLIASESSLKSPYVADEIERAIQKERELIGRKNKGEYDGETDVLFPVRIDDYIFEKWEHERKADVVKKVIADARGWENDNAKYRNVRDKLIADLKKQSDI
ncbi:MAG: toll/interleukin-1 receptor domain-containing protein [Candidatus Zixiibacteriota bacterium]